MSGPAGLLTRTLKAEFQLSELRSPAPQPLLSFRFAPLSLVASDHLPLVANLRDWLIALRFPHDISMTVRFIHNL